MVWGYNLKKGWDYIESFTQVVSADANRILIATSVWFAPGVQRFTMLQLGE